MELILKPSEPALFFKHPSEGDALLEPKNDHVAFVTQNLADDDDRSIREFDSDRMNAAGLEVEGTR